MSTIEQSRSSAEDPPAEAGPDRPVADLAPPTAWWAAPAAPPAFGYEALPPAWARPWPADPGPWRPSTPDSAPWPPVPAGGEPVVGWGTEATGTTPPADGSRRLNAILAALIMLIAVTCVSAAVFVVVRHGGSSSETAASGASSAISGTALIPPTIAATTTTTAPRTLPTAPAPAGYTVVIDTEAGFTIAIPAAWQQVPLDEALFDDMIAALRPDNPKLAAILDEFRSYLRSGARLLAVDPVSGTEVTVMTSPSLTLNLDDLYRALVAELPALGGKVVSHGRVHLPAGDAMKVRIEATVTGPAGPLTVRETQYIFVSDFQAFVITGIGSTAAVDAIANTFTVG